jgi:hypothetical protein
VACPRTREVVEVDDPDVGDSCVDRSFWTSVSAYSSADSTRCSM